MHNADVMSTYPTIRPHTSISFAKLFTIFQLTLVSGVWAECFQVDAILAHITHLLH